MKKILLLGRGGYVGSSFAEYISRFEGYEANTVSSHQSEWEGISFSGYDAVYNVSGLAHTNARKASEQLYYEINGELPVKMAEKAKRDGVPLFIHMSSMIVYGNMSALGEPKLITADTVPEPDGIYGRSKLAAEEGLRKLEDGSFRVAVLRPPLIYGENAKDNFPRLVKFAMASPVFPSYPNEQSMIYIDNLCELVRLIIDEGQGGIYYPQQEEYIHTAQLVADIARESGHKITVTPVFDPFLKLFSARVGFIRKAFGNLTYEKGMSEHFGGSYRRVSCGESIKRTVKGFKK